jgi:DNA-binding NarL/FixJ family response regulator
MTEEKRGRGRPAHIHPTDREREVLQLVYDGWDNKSIARKLNISPLTVKRHLYILSKHFDIKSRTRLVTLALERGWLKLPKEETQ